MSLDERNLQIMFTHLWNEMVWSDVTGGTRWRVGSFSGIMVRSGAFQMMCLQVLHLCKQMQEWGICDAFRDAVASVRKKTGYISNTITPSAAASDTSRLHSAKAEPRPSAASSHLNKLTWMQHAVLNQVRSGDRWPDGQDRDRGWAARAPPEPLRQVHATPVTAGSDRKSFTIRACRKASGEKIKPRTKQ